MVELYQFDIPVEGHKELGAVGHFVGVIRTDWMSDGNGDRSMRIVLDAFYIDDSGREWKAPAGSIVDGASIPKFFWRLLGSPYCGDYRVASVFHDVACVNKRRPWQTVHRMFNSAMRDCGVRMWKRLLIFWAVWCFGPRWKVKG